MIRYDCQRPPLSTSFATPPRAQVFSKEDKLLSPLRGTAREDSGKSTHGSRISPHLRRLPRFSTAGHKRHFIGDQGCGWTPTVPVAVRYHPPQAPLRSTPPRAWPRSQRVLVLLLSPLQSSAQQRRRRQGCHRLQGIRAVVLCRRPPVAVRSAPRVAKESMRLGPSIFAAPELSRATRMTPEVSLAAGNLRRRRLHFDLPFRFAPQYSIEDYTNEVARFTDC